MEDRLVNADRVIDEILWTYGCLDVQENNDYDQFVLEIIPNIIYEHSRIYGTEEPRFINITPILQASKLTGWGTPRDLLDVLRMQPVVEIEQWKKLSDEQPEPFMSVLGYMTDAGDFPSVRECYSIGKLGGEMYFPALGEFHPVSHWKHMPQPPKEECE